MPEIPTPYGGLVISLVFAGKAMLVIAACGLGMKYIVMRLLTHRFGIKPLLWLLAFIGVNVVSWPLVTSLVSVLGDNQFLAQLADKAGLWFVLPLTISFEIIIGIVEGIAFGLIFSKFGTLRKWVVASIVANIIGFIAGFVATMVIEQWFYRINH
mgnify:CR=1 FL=1